MAVKSDKEKALQIIANQIKGLDDNSISLAVLDQSAHLKGIRDRLFSMIRDNGFELTLDYKIKQKG